MHRITFLRIINISGLALLVMSSNSSLNASDYVSRSFGSIPLPLPAATELFTDIGAGLFQLCCSQLAWGDYDNDGDLDLLITGETAIPGYRTNTRLYRNDGGTFAEVSTGFPGVSVGAAAWGDYDNDGDLDLLLAGVGESQLVASVYRNDSGAFVDIGAGLVGIRDGAAVWGDYDNDGNLDIAIGGCDDGFPTCNYSTATRIYRNQGESTFSDIGAGLPGVYASSLAWGDYDNDGDLDLLAAGSTISSTISSLYRNDGGGVFTDSIAGFPAVQYGAVAWGDYDNDGDLDLVLAGSSLSGQIARVYRNDGGTFTDVNAGLAGVVHSTVAWGDYDNDGDLDLLLSGQETEQLYQQITRVYRNDGDGVFTDIVAGLPGLYYSSNAWGDYDNDGDLDFAVTGLSDADGLVSRIYRSNAIMANTAPSTPSGLSASVVDTTVGLVWDAAGDAETLASGLTYNVRVGTTPGGSDVLAAMADTATGYRRVPQLGNAQHGTNMTLENLAPGTSYYWSVQAGDTAFAGSPFAAEGSFTTLPDLIFADGFESGNFSAWSGGKVDGGDLSVGAGAALVGSFGMQALIDDANPVYVTDDSPEAEPRYRARFYFDPDSLTMAAGVAHDLFHGFSGASAVVLRVEFRFTGTRYQVRARARDDANAWVNTPWFNLPDRPHFLELDWRAATAAELNDGGLTFWIDGVQRADLTGIDNDTRRIDRVRLGAVAGLDAGTSGTYYFDHFESRRDSYIGP